MRASESRPWARLVWSTGQVRYPPLERFWKPMISLDKSGETLENSFWMVKHIDLSPNFFDASLLIVQLSYDSNKI
jgi:hypothetical protein